MHPNDLEERTNYVVGKNDIEVIKTFLTEQKTLGKTLELGCGNGTYSEILIREAEYLTVTDFSDEMVAVSKKRLKGIGNISVEKANCFSLSYPDSSFDTVFMANLLHVIPEPEKAVAEGKRVLNKNGRLILDHQVFYFYNDNLLLLHYVFIKPPLYISRPA